MVKEKKLDIKEKLARVFDDSLQTKQWANIVDYIILGLIVVSTVEVFLSTYDSIVARYSHILKAVDIFTTIFFTIEVTLRIWVADLIDEKYKGFLGRLRYCFSFYGMIDILSTYTFYIAFLLPIPHTMLKALRIARLMRIFRYVKAFNVLSEALTSKKNELLVSLQFLIITTLILSFILFFVEHEAQPEIYDNGWTSVIWAFAQYIGDPGDFADTPPITSAGHVIAFIVGVLGIAIFAVPAGLVGSAFSEVMEKEEKKEKALRWSEDLHKAFERKMDRYTRYQIVPPYVTIPEAQARIYHKEDEILDAVSIAKDMRLINLASTRPLGEYSDDRLSVELFPVNTSYGCCINRNSKITIVAPSNMVDPIIGNFAYYTAMMGGFNYISREKGIMRPYRSYYMFDDEHTIENLHEYMEDLRKLSSKENSWCITFLTASGYNEPEFKEQIHFEYGGKRNDDRYEGEDLLVKDSENLRTLYNMLSEELENKFNIKISRQKYHDTSSPKNFLRKIGNQTNGLMLRMAYSLICWDSRRIEIAKTMAQVFNQVIEPEKTFIGDSELKVKDTGYSYKDIQYNA